jgi:hypothetical protein
MALFTLQTTHNLGREEAARRLQDKIGVVRDKYGANVNNLDTQWLDHTLSFGFKVMGMSISGTVHVEDANVTLNTELPFAAMLFKSSIEQRIRQELGDLLN